MAALGNARPDDRSWLVVVASPVISRAGQGHIAATGGKVPSEVDES